MSSFSNLFSGITYEPIHKHKSKSSSSKHKSATKKSRTKAVKNTAKTSNTAKSSATGKKSSSGVVYRGYKFNSIKRSKLPNKKYEAHFKHTKTEKEKVVAFGSVNRKNYIDTNDREYRDFHNQQPKFKVNENKIDLMSSKALERYILWNKPTMNESIDDYKKRLKKQDKTLRK